MIAFSLADVKRLGGHGPAIPAIAEPIPHRGEVPPKLEQPDLLWITGLRTAAFRTAIVVAILATHAAWLAWSAGRQSPTLNEPGHLVSGIAHWRFSRYEPYRVNPPLVRKLAALPVMWTGCEVDWTAFDDAAGARPEFAMGYAFVKANGPASQRLFVMARRACIPLSVLGAWLAYLWAKELYGYRSGLLALMMWSFEPGIIGHGQLLTPDMGATTAGIAATYSFWRWLHDPRPATCIWAAVGLGFALVTKFSWVFLILLWPLLACTLGARIARHHGRTPMSLLRRIRHLLFIEVGAIAIINGAYFGDESFTPLGQFSFVSRTFTGRSMLGVPGNRFDGIFLSSLPVPVPKQWLLGLDLQNKDLEDYAYQSYLLGEWRDKGWWYYYLYAAAIKIPLGLLFIAAMAFVKCVFQWWHSRRARRWDEVVMLIPAIVLLVAVSSQLEFNHHFRYILPCIGLLVVFSSSILSGAGTKVIGCVLTCLLWGVVSSACCAPYSLSYFNELAGGPMAGSQHLLHSNIDWGQDLLTLKEWSEGNPELRPLYIAYYGFINPRDLGVPGEPAPYGPFWEGAGRVSTFRPGWYAVSINYLHGCEWRLPRRWAYTGLEGVTPVARCGHSIRVYHIDQAAAERLESRVSRREAISDATAPM